MGVSTSRLREVFKWQMITATAVSIVAAVGWKYHRSQRQAKIKDYYYQLNLIEAKEDKIKKEKWKKWIQDKYALPVAYL